MGELHELCSSTNTDYRGEDGEIGSACSMDERKYINIV